MGRKRKKRIPSRSEKLAEALIGVHSTDAKDKAAMYELVVASISAFKQGLGIPWSEFEEMLDELYGPDPLIQINNRRKQMVNEWMKSASYCRMMRDQHLKDAKYAKQIDGPRADEFVQCHLKFARFFQTKFLQRRGIING